MSSSAKRHKRDESADSSSSSSDGGSGDDNDEQRKKRRGAKKQKVQKDATLELLSYVDNASSQKFIWAKKIEQDKKKKKKSSERSEEEEKRQREEKQREIMRLQEQRLRRENEKQQLEAERERLFRERESKNFEELERKEELFHMKQARLAVELRLNEGRARVVDCVWRNLQMLDPETRDQQFAVDVAFMEPYHIFDSQPLKELELIQQDLLAQVQVTSPNQKFWEAMLTVCKDEIKEAQTSAAQEKAVSLQQQQQQLSQLQQQDVLQVAQVGIHDSVKREVATLFDGKNSAELEKMRLDIQHKIENPDGGVDVEYWDSVLKRLAVYQARATIREVHKQVMDIYHQQMRNKYSSHHHRHHHHTQPNSSAPITSSAQKNKPISGDDGRTALNASSSEELTSEALLAASLGNMDDQLFQEEAANPLHDDEEVFGDEVQLLQKKYSWADKYRPRKPKYYNRVHAGFEWNKYNRTHYSSDDPPPKTIQGYKFNVFYPDLIDKSVTPKFFLEKTENPDWVIIRFHGGPPYEDIAFRIVNRMWEKSHRRGYKCTFEKGVLHLWFKFKRFRYRR